LPGFADRVNSGSYCDRSSFSFATGNNLAIPFLGLLSAGQFSGEKQTFIVLTLLAFQNGFFWQTVLKRESDRTAPALAGGPKRGRD